MAKIKTYNDLSITVLHQTPNPAEIVQMALNRCMHKDDKLHGKLTTKACRRLVDAGHMSPFEHASMTILISNISRAFLAQITRQRTFKFTSSSQHYQDYRDYPMIISPKYNEYPSVTQRLYDRAFDQTLQAYEDLVDEGVPVEEARMVLPQASTVHLQVTMDANNLAKFLMVRLCQRNVFEMYNFSQHLCALAVKWFPELFSNIYSHCFMYKYCNQGSMQATKCIGRWPTSPLVFTEGP